MDTLLACPHCANFGPDLTADPDDGHVTWAGYCPMCGAYGPRDDDRSVAASKWNMRGDARASLNNPHVALVARKD